MCLVFRKYHHCHVCNTMKWSEYERELCPWQKQHDEMFLFDEDISGTTCVLVEHDIKFEDVAPEKCPMCCREEAKKNLALEERKAKEREKKQREEDEKRRARAGLTGDAAPAA